MGIQNLDLFNLIGTSYLSTLDLQPINDVGNIAVKRHPHSEVQ